MKFENITTLKKNSTKANHYINEYNNAKYTSIYHCYCKPSYHKEKAEENCLARCREFNGYGYRVLSFNTCVFIAGYIAEMDAKTWLVVETAQNIYKIEL